MEEDGMSDSGFSSWRVNYITFTDGNASRRTGEILFSMLEGRAK